jgi:hypothetical protein
MQMASLLPWRELRKASHMNRNTARLLEKVGRRQGANPDQWFGSLNQISLDDIPAIEVIDDALNWVSVKDAVAAG